jgi:hypothetical protein
VGVTSGRRVRCFGGDAVSAAGPTGLMTPVSIAFWASERFPNCIRLRCAQPRDRPEGAMDFTRRVALG